MTEEKPFRILLDLSQLGSNYSRYVWMNISPRELCTIGELKIAVSRKLNYDRKDLKLFIHDGLLPDEEKIIILRDNDTVKVYNEDPSRSLHLSSNSSVFFTSRASDPDCTCVTNAENVKKRKRPQSVVLNISDEYDPDNNTTAKKKRKYKSNNVDINEGSDILNNPDEYDPDNNTTAKKKKNNKSNNVDLNGGSGLNENSLEKKSKKKSAHKSKPSPETVDTVECLANTGENEVFQEVEVNYSQNLSEQEWIPTSSEQVSEQVRSVVKSSSIETEPEVEPVVINDKTVVHSNNCKKKRKRHKKRKSLPSTIDDLFPGNESVSTECFTNNTNTFQPPTDKFSCIRKHIRFDSPCPSESIDVMELDSYLTKIKSGSTVESLKSSEGVQSLPSSPFNPIRVSDQRSSTPTLRKIVKHTSWSLSPMTNEKKFPPSGLVKEIDSSEDKKKNGKAPLESYPTLNTMPSVGAHIAYKVLELDENYSPVVSAYKEGIVKRIENDTENLEIELLQEEVKPGRTGKFENLKKDEVPQEEVFKSVIISWPSLIDPRFISG